VNAATDHNVEVSGWCTKRAGLSKKAFVQPVNVKYWSNLARMKRDASLLRLQNTLLIIFNVI